MLPETAMLSEVQIPDELRTYPLKVVAKALGRHERSLRRQLDKQGIPVVYPTERTPSLTYAGYKQLLGLTS
jgi:hypothetical protein